VNRLSDGCVAAAVVLGILVVSIAIVFTAAYLHDDVTLVTIDGHDYIKYHPVSGHGGSIIHSESCKHESHSLLPPIDKR
jgi:hypothetical protein